MIFYKTFLILFISLLFNNVNANLLLDNNMHKSPKTILFFLGDSAQISSQINIIKSLPKPTFLIFYGSNIDKTLINEFRFPNTLIEEVNFPLTSWTQDRILRLENNNIEFNLSDHIYLSHSLYESAIINKLKKHGFHSKTNLKYLSQYTGKDPFISLYNTSDSKYLPIVINDEYYGDGGDRIYTDNRLFLANKKQRVPKEKYSDIIYIDNSNYQYFFHLDMYFTPINKNKIILGSVEQGLHYIKESSLAISNEFDIVKMREKIEQEKQIISNLKLNNIEIIKIPIFINKDNQIISWNNLIFNEKEVIVSSYDFKNKNTLLHYFIQNMQLNIKKTFKKMKLNVKFIEGGENNLFNGGQIRCMTAILE